MARKLVPVVPKLEFSCSSSCSNEKINANSRTQSKSHHFLTMAKFWREKYFGALVKFASFMVWKKKCSSIFQNFFFWHVQQQTLNLGYLFPNSCDNDLQQLDHPIFTKVWKHPPEPRHIKLPSTIAWKVSQNMINVWNGSGDVKKRLGEGKRVQANAEDLKIGTFIFFMGEKQAVVLS